MVHEGCLDERDGRQSHNSERRSGRIVRLWLLDWYVTLTSVLRLGSGCLGTFEKTNWMHFDLLPIDPHLALISPSVSTVFSRLIYSS